MKRRACLVLASALAAAGTVAAPAMDAQAPAIKKNWTPPAHRMYAQALVDETMAKHPELLSLTLQGAPPGEKGIYTMFAGSFPDRIGKVSSEVDELVITRGYTILDPRWKKDDNPGKSVYLLPLRDRSGQNIGLAVIAFRIQPGSKKSEKDFFLEAASLRDALAARIPSHAALFAPAAKAQS
jgi:hypothetical protein